MSPKIVFAALLFCCVFLGFGNAGILRRPSYQETPNYSSHRSSSPYPSNIIVQNPGMSGSVGGLGQNSGVWGGSWNWNQQLGWGGLQSAVLGSQSLGSYNPTGSFQFKIPLVNIGNIGSGC